MRSLVVGLIVAGCGGSSSSPPVAPAKPAEIEPPPATLTVRRFTIINAGRKAGSFVITTNGLSINYVYDVLENGRGPHVEAKLELGADGLPQAFRATGHHEMGAKIDEVFTRDATHARWASPEEHGEGDAKKPAFFSWFSDGPGDPWLVPAALQRGGQVALWPFGEAKVDKVKDLTVQDHALTAYAVSGFGFSPYYVWFEKGAYVGYAVPGYSLLPEGDDNLAEPLAAASHQLELARGDQLAHTIAHRPPASGYAYTHARVLDVEKGSWLADQTVLVVGDKIMAVGKKVQVPAAAESIDLKGKALIPGLVDMHSHTDRAGGMLDIATGITTVRDVGNIPDDLDEMKKSFDEGSQVGPHLVRMGFIEGRNQKAASSVITAETPEEANAAVEFFAKRGYDGIKIYNSVKVELVPILAAEAHKRNMLVIGHIPVHMLAHEAVDAGYDGIEHINMLFLNFLATKDTDTRDTTRFTLVGEHATEIDLNGTPMKDFIAQLQKHHTTIDPTLGAFEDLFEAVPGVVTPDLATIAERLPSQQRRSMLAATLPMTAETHAKYLQAWAQLLALTKVLWESKVTVVAGTDSGWTGLALHHELELFVAAGIPAAGALKAATIDSARAMKQDKIFGTIAVGKRADLVVVDGDPVADITQLRKVVSTMRGGVIYDARPLLDAASVAP